MNIALKNSLPLSIIILRKNLRRRYRMTLPKVMQSRGYTLTTSQNAGDGEAREEKDEQSVGVVKSAERHYPVVVATATVTACGQFMTIFSSLVCASLRRPLSTVGPNSLVFVCPV